MATEPHDIRLPVRSQLTLPLLRRESIGGLYHVLTFDHPEGTNALPGQFTMVRGAEWGAALDVVVGALVEQQVMHAR